MKRATGSALLVMFVAILAGCPPLPDPRVHYICFGDSVTQGFPDASYPMFLEQRLVSGVGEQPGCVANRGQYGDVACQCYPRLQENIQESLFPNAHTVLFWEMGNDVFLYLYEHNHELDHGPTQQEIQDIRSMTFSCLGEAVSIVRNAELGVYLATYFYVIPGKPITGYEQGLTEAQAVIANQYVDVLNEAIIGFAASQAVPFAPVHLLGVLGGSPDYYYDGMHPNADGYRLIADVWYSTITGSM